MQCASVSEDARELTNVVPKETIGVWCLWTGVLADRWFDIHIRGLGIAAYIGWWGVERLSI